MTRIALIGFGEVGRILAEDLSASAAGLSVFDLKFSDPKSGPSTAAQATGIWAAPSAREAVAGCDIIISAVTAAQTLAAAKSTVRARSSPSPPRSPRIFPAP